MLAHDERAGERALVLGQGDRLDAHRVARPLAGYSEIGVRLPYPFSVTTSSSWSSRATSMARTELPRCADVHARTPLVSRPIARTRSSLKRAAWPERETMMMSSLPLVRRTAISSSSSRMLIAMMPSALIGVL